MLHGLISVACVPDNTLMPDEATDVNNALCIAHAMITDHCELRAG